MGEPSGGFFECVLGASSSRLLALPGFAGSWGILVRPGASWAFLKRSVTSWVLPWASWRVLGLPDASWVGLGFLGLPGLPEASWGILVLPGMSRGFLRLPGHLRGFRGFLGASWGLPGLFWGIMGASWVPPWASCGILGLPGSVLWPPWLRGPIGLFCPKYSLHMCVWTKIRLHRLEEQPRSQADSSHWVEQFCSSSSLGSRWGELLFCE